MGNFSSFNLFVSLHLDVNRETYSKNEKGVIKTNKNQIPTYSTLQLVQKGASFTVTCLTMENDGIAMTFIRGVTRSNLQLVKTFAT